MTINLIRFNFFCSWSIIFNLLTWSIPALCIGLLLASCGFFVLNCEYYMDIYICLHLYIMMKEGFSLFLVNTLYVADKIMEGGGRFRNIIQIFFPRFRFFLHYHSDWSLLESGRSAFSTKPNPKNKIYTPPQ